MKFPFLKEATRNLFSKPSTVEYTFKVKEAPAKPNYRGKISYDPEKCINCKTCMQVCCPQAITMITEEAEGGTNVTYEFDMTSCTFCGTCQDFCDEGAIRMTDDYHMVAEDPADLIVRGTKFKPDLGLLIVDEDSCIFCTLCARNCAHEAIMVDRVNKIWEVDHSKCAQCGLCLSKCPKKALSFKSAEEVATIEAEIEAKKEAAVLAEMQGGAEETETKLQCSDDCIFCGLCVRNCPQEAITVDRAAKTWSCDHEKCISCGLCESKCPKKALSFK